MLLKRVFDIISSFIALLIIAPIFLPLMIALRFSGEGEVFYRQKRIGRNEEAFDITKFATMLKDSPNIGAGEHTLRDDPRVLPLGKFLRSSKINELPQIWDVFVGNMSIVGPRPTTSGHHALYPNYYAGVLKKVPPGITGIGSVVFRDEEHILSIAKDHDYCYSSEIVPYKAELEQWYSENRSFNMDIILCLLTFWVIISPKNTIMKKIYPTIPFKDISDFGLNAK
ncbi:sugar transferase [Emcibacteraceae bacterium]|nr:sugar transferase [Emcibacteraceae bacterium]